MERGDLGADSAAMGCVYDEITALRAHFATLSYLYEACMPLAYVCFVDLLVEALIVYLLLHYFSITLGGVLRLWVLSALRASLIQFYM